MQIFLSKIYNWVIYLKFEAVGFQRFKSKTVSWYFLIVIIGQVLQSSKASFKSFKLHFLMCLWLF